VSELIGLLKEAGVERLVDVRSVPRSRANPQFNADALPAPLAASGIGYTHLAALGGLRHHPKEAPPSPNTLWRNDAFRNYADYAMSPAFQVGLDQLCGLARDERCAIMCAEAVWWRCHRRIVADYLLARGVAVTHIMGPAKLDPASPTPGARNLPDGTILSMPTRTNSMRGHHERPLCLRRADRRGEIRRRLWLGAGDRDLLYDQSLDFLGDHSRGLWVALCRLFRALPSLTRGTDDKDRRALV